MKRIRRIFTPSAPALKVRRTVTGLGIITDEPIKRGTCVAEYIGRPVVGDEQYTHRGKYLFETGRGTMIDGNIPENIARYINHSCRPNCEVEVKKRRIFIFAMRTIKAGEELTYDYDTEYFDAHIKPHGCRCAKCSPSLHAKR